MATAELGVGYLSIIPETSKIAPGIKQALKQSEQVASKSGKSIGSTLSGALSKTLKVGLGSAAAAATGIIGTSVAKGLGRLNALDQANSMLQGLKLSAEDVSRSMEGVNKSVKGTAFGLDEAAGSAAKLTAVGVGVGEDLDRALKLTADIAAQGQTSMDDVSSIMAKIAGAGKVTGETLAQLDDRATGAGAALAKHLNVSIEEARDQVSKGKVDFETFQQAMETHLGGAAQKTGETVQGAFKNMGAAAGRMGASLAAPGFSAAIPIFSSLGSAFDSVNDALKPVSERMTEVLEPAAERVSGVIETRLAPALGEGAGKLGEVALKLVEAATSEETWDKLSGVFGDVSDTIERLWPSLESLAGSFATVGQNISVATWNALTSALNAAAPLIENVVVPLVEKVAQFAETNPGAIQAIVSGFLGFKAVKGVAGPVGSLVTNVTNLGGAAKVAGKAFSKGGLGGGLVTLLEHANSSNPVLASMGKKSASFGKVLAKLGPAFGKLGSFATKAIGFVHPWVAGITLIGGALTWFFTKTETGQKLWESFVEKLGAGWDWVVEKFQTGVQWVKDVFGGLFTLWGEGDFTSTLGNALGISEDSWLVSAVLTIRDTILGVVDSVKNAFSVAADFLSGVFNTIWQAAQVTIGVIGTVVLTPFILAWEAVSAAAVAVWENAIKPTWEAMQTGATWLWENVLMPAFEGIKAGFQAVGDAISWVWNNVIKAVWDALGQAANWLWNNALKPAFDWIKQGFQTVGDVLSKVWNTIKSTVFDAWNAVVLGVQEKWWIFTSTVRALWGGLQEGMSIVVDKIRDHVFVPLMNAFQQVRDFVGTIVEGIRAVWENLRGHLARPINFMINTVYNDGILTAWNIIADILPGLKKGDRLSGIPEHATGGAIRGPGSGTSDDVLMWGSNGEHMWTASEVKDVGGHAAMYAMREFVRTGRPFIMDARGQLVGLPDTTKNTVGDLVGAAPGLFPAYRDGGEIRPMWEHQLEAAHKFAQSQSGKPYQWAGPKGPGQSFDCSGFMASIAAVIQGTNPWQRYWGTQAFAGGNTVQGFVPGLGPGFSIGLFNGGPWGGHTSGTLGPVGPYAATNVESGGGSRTVKYGPGAVGADHSQFTHTYHLPIGADGAFVSGGAGGISPEAMRAAISKRITSAIDKIMGPISGLLPSGPPAWLDIPRGVYESGKKGLADKAADSIAGLSDRLGSVYAAVSDMGDLVQNAARGVAGWLSDRLGLYDTGGVLRHGAMAVNLSGADEIIINGPQLQAINNLATNVGVLVGELRKAADATSEQGIMARSFASQMGDLFGDVGLSQASSTISTLIDAENRLTEARIGQKTRLDEISAAEKTLADAQKALTKAQESSSDLTVKQQRKLDDAIAAVEKAKKPDKKGKVNSDRVADAEKKLARVREDLEAEGVKSAEKRAESIKKANEEVSKAEENLAQKRQESAKALDIPIGQLIPGLSGLLEKAAGATSAIPALSGALGGLAAAAGPAGISVGVAIQAVSSVIQVGKMIFGLIDKIRQRLWDARKAEQKVMADGFSTLSDWYALVSKQQETVASLQQQLIRQTIAFKQAQFQLRIAQADRFAAEAEGIVKVTTAAAALWDYEARMRGGMIAGYEDLSLAYDRMKNHAGAALGAANQAVERTTEWRALAYEYFEQTARAEVQRLEASKAMLNAYKQIATTALAVQRSSADMARAQTRLAQMEQKRFEMSQKQALVGTELQKVQARILEKEEWYNRFGNRVRNLGTSAINVGIDNKWAKANVAYHAELDALKKRRDELAEMLGNSSGTIASLEADAKLAGQLGRAGSDAGKYIGTTTTEASLALDSFKFQDQLNQLDDQKLKLERMYEDSELENRFAKQSLALDQKLAGVNRLAEAFDARAKAEREENQAIRDALLNEAQVKESIAQALGVTPVQVKNLHQIQMPEPREQVTKIVQVPAGKSAISMDEYEATLGAFDIRLEKVENPRPGGAELALARR